MRNPKKKLIATKLGVAICQCLSPRMDIWSAMPLQAGRLYAWSVQYVEAAQ